jgi:RNA polymerase sigma-70 factor (ECF subfamily)
MTQTLAPTGTARPDVIAWMDAAVAGDRQAFGRLYEHYHPVVLRFVRHRVRDLSRAEDLAADTFAKALRQIGTFAWVGRDPGAWFITIARNLVADHFKSGRYRVEITTDDILNAAPAAASSLGNPDVDVLAHLDHAELRKALLLLGDEQRECVILRFFRGLDVRETAAAMGKQETAIKALQFRAVRALERVYRTGKATGKRDLPLGPPPVARVPAPRQPEPDPVPEPVREPEPLVRRIAWRCSTCTRRYAQPYATHGAPRPCGGWLEVVDLAGATP